MDTKLYELVRDFTTYARRTENEFLVQVAAELNSLAFENVELKNKLWATTRAAHTHDPLEGEDG